MRYASLVLLVLVIYGCANQQEQADDRGTYIGWYCAGEGSDNRNWQCHKRRMRNGRPVDDEVLDSGEEKLAQLAEQQERDRQQVAAASNASAVAQSQATLDDKSWRNQLPEMTAIESAPEPEAERQTLAAAAVREDRPVPEPEPAFDTWADEVIYQKQNQSESRPVPAASTTADSEASSLKKAPQQKKPAVQTAQNTWGYTVQLGAFSTSDALDKFIVMQKLSELPTSRYRLMSRGKLWHVLTFGQFANRDQAEKAWALQAEDHPGLDIWVRSLPSLDAARVDSGN